MSTRFPRNWADWEEEGDKELDEYFSVPYIQPGTPTWPDPAKLEKREVTQDEINRWASWTRPFPLPEYMVPTGGRLFDNLTDEQILAAPPHLIAHLQRTAAQGGLQIISPRQTPFSFLMNRTVDDKRELGDHVVGSIASRDDEWPTVDDADFSTLLPDEPLPPPLMDPHVRERTRTEPLTRAAHLMRDPILACLIKGRAVIDIQQRDDVMGDSDGLTEILARAWSIDKQDLMDLDAFSLGVDGPLLRHAIRSDDVYPLVHAPIHRLRSISVSSNDASRDSLPKDSAMDWRRMRVFCEAVYLMSTGIEGIPLRLARADPPPGDPGAPLNRPNILAFRPAPCTAWSFESKGFSIYPVMPNIVDPAKQIPPEVLAALARYTEVVKPMSHAMTKGHAARARVSKAVTVDMPSGETITDGYMTMISSLTVGAARGRDAARALRNYIYEAVEAAPLDVRLKLARYMKIANEECKIHLQVRIVPDKLIFRLADRFLTVGSAIRSKIAAEAARRHTTIEEWWHNVTSLVPTSYRAMSEGTMGWAKIAMWLIFRKPTDKWDKLVNKMHYEALRNVEVAAVGSVALPPVHRSEERVLHAARSYVSGMTAAYHGYYTAVADVGYIIADLITDSGKPRKADVVREACYLWYLRARAFRGTNVNAIDSEAPTPSMNHLRARGAEFDLIIAPAPYRAFCAYKTHVAKSNVIHKERVSEIMRFDGDRISDLFANMVGPFAAAPVSTITRYLLDPPKLASDLESAWRMLAEDVARVIAIYGADADIGKKTSKPPEPEILTDIETTTLSKPVNIPKTGKNFYEVLGELDIDEADWVDDTLDKLDPVTVEEITVGCYENIGELRKVLMGAVKIHDSTTKNESETVK